MNAGYGLAVRWSLENAPEDAPARLREYVVGTSIAKFMFLDGLAFKVWRMREGEWFEGTYVFDAAKDRDDFQRNFLEGADTSPGSRIIGFHQPTESGLSPSSITRSATWRRMPKR